MIQLPGPDSELLRTFLSVAEHGNTTKAAAATNRTQSSVSLRIKKLEQLLDVELFQRSARGMKLNQSGRALQPEAQRVIDDVDQLAASFRERLAGTVRIGIPDDYGRFVLENALAQFSGRHPDVVVSVTCGCSGAFPDLIDAGDLDLAIYSAPPSKSADAFFTEPVVWAAHRDLVLNSDDVLPLALFDRSCWWSDVPSTALANAGRPARVLFSSASHDGIRAAISARLAVGILPRSVLPSGVIELTDLPLLPPSSLVLLQSDTSRGDAAQGSVTRRGASSAVVSTMSDAIIDAFAALGP